MLQFIAIAASTFISEDLACIAAGSLAAAAEVSLTSAIAASLVGIVVGDLLLYAAGFFGGRALLRFRIARRYLSPEKLLSAERWFAERGNAIVVLSRFVPGMRLPTYVAAGALRMPLLRFSLLLVAAAAVWTPALVAASFYSGTSFASQISEKSSPRFWLAIGAAFVVMWLLLGVARSLVTFKGRRLLYSKWQRLLRWEFWPMWVLYVPVGFYVLYLGIRHRSLTAFMACNPGIFASGIKGESKSEILHELCRKLPNFGRIAPFVRISAAADVAKVVHTVQSQMKKMRLRFPVVLKPDVGERGNGVVIARSVADIESFASAASGDFILQKYIAGHEFGVFYFRYPHQSKGEILAITDKRLITLTGDGVSDLQTLILKDARAVLMARFHLQNHQANLTTIIPVGTVYPLVNLGTHCKGALFLEGKQYISETLTTVIDKISANFKGFYFGRYDIRVPNEMDFIAGKNIHVIELNGVTSEATSIYDPQYTIWHAYKTLFRQWRIATEIGAENIRRGVRPVSLRELVRIFL